MPENKSFFEELKSNVGRIYNSNFRFDSLDWVTRVWVFELCKLIDEKIKTCHEDIENNFKK